MSITRRNLLRTIASLSAAHSLSGFAFAPPTKPKATSIYVLFEGPWLFYPTGNEMTALAAGESIPPYMHDCLYGLGTPNNKNIKDPKIFDNGKTFAANVTNAARANSFTEAFQVPFATDPFLWITGQAPYVTPRTYDRVVTLPLPSKIYVAGKLKTAAVTQGTQSLKPPATGPLADIRPYVVTILEYAPSGPAHVGLTLTDSATPRIFTPNDHLIFRLMHKSMGPGTPADDAKHVKDAFDDLIARVTTTGTPLQIAPTDSSCDIGTDTGGFDQDELGLDPSGLLDRMPRLPPRRSAKTSLADGTKRLTVSTFANCAGGGSPGGP